MSKSLVEQSDLPRAVVGTYQYSAVLAGTATTEYVLVKGGTHPKMRVIGDAGHIRSVSLSIEFTTADPVIAIIHEDGREAAVTAGGLSAAYDMEKFTVSSTEGDDVFEADEDVLIKIKSGGNAASTNLVFVSFEPVEEY